MTSHSELTRVADELAVAEAVHIDTEFESSRQGRTLCLIQALAAESGEVYLIDALKLTALEPLAKALGRADLEWVLHAGLQDLELLRERLHVEAPARLFDTQIAWAMMSAEYSVSLAYLGYRVLGVRPEKRHQADDWTRRPLPASQLAYAAADVASLPALRKVLGERAERLHRLEAIWEASHELLHPQSEAPSHLTLDSFRGAWQLDLHSQAALRYLLDWYNALDEKERLLVPEPKTLLNIALRLPASGDELGRIKGVPRRFAAELGDRLTGEMLRKTAQADAADFVPIEPTSYATFEDILLDAWLGQARAEICAELCIAPELALPAKLVRRLRDAVRAKRAPEAIVALLSGYRKQLLAEPLLRFIKKHPPPAR